MTDSADRFLTDIRTSWDSPAPWQATAERGLSQYDQDALRGFCRETGEDYAAAEAEVLAAIRERASV